MPACSVLFGPPRDQQERLHLGAAMLALRRRVRAVRKPSAKRVRSPGPIRYWDPHRAKRVSKLSPGQSYISTTDELLVSVVGNTVVVSIRDPDAGLVAMSNLVATTHGLPALEETARRSAHRYIEQVLQDLYENTLIAGAQPHTLEVTLIGDKDNEEMGPVNETLDLCRDFFAQHSIMTRAEFIGSGYAKKVYTSLRDPSPDVLLLREVSSTVSQREQRYAQQIQLEHLLGARKTTMKFS